MSLRSDTRGATYVEFLIAFIPVFLLFLGLIQAGLLYTATLVVTHSAAPPPEPQSWFSPTTHGSTVTSR